MRKIGLKYILEKQFLGLADRFRLPTLSIQSMKAKCFVVTSNPKLSGY